MACFGGGQIKVICFSGVFSGRDHWDGWLHKSVCLPLESGDSNTKENQRQMEAWGRRPHHSSCSRRKCCAGTALLFWEECHFMLILIVEKIKTNTTVFICFFSNCFSLRSNISLSKTQKQHKQGCWHCSTRLQSHNIWHRFHTLTPYLCLIVHLYVCTAAFALCVYCRAIKNAISGDLH